MISHRKAILADVNSILKDLSEITRSEIAACGADESDVSNTAAHLFSMGPSEISFSGDAPLFIVGHGPIGDGRRGTWCLAGSATERLRRETLLAARGQVERLLAGYPGRRFVAVSYSTHPRRDWFFAQMGFHKREDHGNAAVFELLPPENSVLDS